MAYLFGRFDASKYLGVYFLPGAGELTIFCGALLGALWLAARKSVLGLNRVIFLSSCIFGIGLMAFSFSRVLWLSLPCLVVTGFGFMTQTFNVTNSGTTAREMNSMGQSPASGQIWMVEHPDRFYPTIDFDWQKQQLKLEGYVG